MNTPLRKLAVLAVASTLVLAGCGRDSGGDGDAASAPGVTDDPCPQAVNEDNGCIYLGAITDLTGTFAGIGVPLQDGAEAFWQRVNEEGGIGGYDIDVTTHLKDNEYNPDRHAQAWNEISGEVLALSGSLGTAATEAMLRDSNAEELVVIPATLGSNWYFEDRVLELGASYCAEGMNAVDYAVDELGADSVAVVHFPGDYGDDAMVGARIAAEERGVEFTDIETAPGADQQAAAVAGILRSGADMVLIATGPLETAAVVGGALQQGFEGQFIGAIPTWNAALLQSPAGPALQASYLWSNSFPAYDADTPGREAMREAAGDGTPNDYFALGWSGQYVMKAALEAAIDNDDLTRAGLLEAATSLSEIDSEGSLPEGSANYAGDANDAAIRATAFFAPDESASTGASIQVDSFTGPTAEGYDFQEACYLQK